MEVIEEVARKKSVVKTENWRKAHSQIKALLEQKFDFSEVFETKFIHHEEKNLIKKDINCIKEMDKYSKIEISVGLEIKIQDDEGEVTLSITTNLKTKYPENTSFQKSLVYFAMRSLWEKFYYGWARAKYRDSAIQLTNEVNDGIVEFLTTIK